MKKALASISTPSPSHETQGKYPLYAASCVTKRANLLIFSIFTGGGRAKKHEESLHLAAKESCNKNHSDVPPRKATSQRGGLFVSALLTVVLGLLLCSCTKEGAEAIHSKTQASDLTSIDTATVGADTIYPGLSLDTAWLGDTTIFFKP